MKLTNDATLKIGSKISTKHEILTLFTTVSNIQIPINSADITILDMFRKFHGIFEYLLWNV